MPRRTDRNQPEIVQALRQMGCTVFVTSTVGGGFPDIVAGTTGQKGLINLLIEIKDHRQPPSNRKLTYLEQKFHSEWKGQVCVVENVDDVIKLINKSRKG